MAALLVPPVGDGAGGPRLVEICIVRLRHLPKMDRFGTCDPYVKIDFMGSDCETSVRHNCYDADFGEHFCFTVRDTGGQIGPCGLHVKDWDKVGNEDIGRVMLPAELMQRIAAAPPGFEAEHTFTLMSLPKKGGRFAAKRAGVGITGHDGEPSDLTVRVRVAEAADLREPPAGAGAGGPRQLELTVVSARHLPKMDLATACDAYVEVHFLGRQFCTRPRHATYSPDWHEHFAFSALEPQAAPGPCELRIKDWDRLTKDDFFGSVVLDEALTRRIASAPIGWEGEHSFEVMHPAPRPGSSELDVPRAVCGHDGEACVLTIRVRVAALLELRLEQVAAHSLPQTDFFGKCDAYCLASVGPDVVARADTVKSNLNPRFSAWQSPDGTRGHAVILRLAGTAALEADPHSRCPLRLTVMDWNRFNADKVVGQPLAPPLASLKGLWTSAPQCRALSLPLTPAAAGSRLSFNLRTEAAAEEAPAPAPQVTKEDLRLQVFLRSGVNLPLNKCHSCRGILPAMDKSHFRVHVRCEGAGRRASAGAAPDVACQPLVKWLSDTPPGVSLKDEIPHSDTHVAVAGEPRGEGGRVQEDEGEEGAGGEAGGGGEAKAGGAGEGENECEEWWPVQVVSFPDADEDALQEGAELVSVHVSLWLVPASEEGGGACEGEFEVGSRCIQLPVPAPPAGLTREQIMEWGGWRQRKRIELFRPPSAPVDPSGGGGEGEAGTQSAAGADQGGRGSRAAMDSASGRRLWVTGDDSELGGRRYVVGADGQGPAVLDVWLVWRFRPDSWKLKDIPLPAPAGNAAWGALARMPAVRGKRGKGQRALLPCPAGRDEQQGTTPATEKKQRTVSASPQDRAVDGLKYVDAPVWRQRNGEVLVGRDVTAHVGMRVVMSRQSLRWRYETACHANSARDIGGLEDVGTITKVLAGSDRLDPNSGPRYTRHNNATSVKVRWDTSGRHAVLPAGLRGNFDLVPLGQDACNLGAPRAGTKTMRAVVDALAATKFVTC